ncbi:M20 aminoacylase family protein [Kiloniella antarctica]|uniref:M20 aminoacylase family protein n=1 Tax=Kiloniella antarctica TaxID=1550907 RepID=A0ABW5BJF3_9PROT
MAIVIPRALSALKSKMTDIRQDLHRHPELGFDEQRTAKIVASELRSYGLEVYEKIGVTGVVGILKSGDSNRAIGLRADMDALPIQETSPHDYPSQNNGVMHACGHDGHTAMLLGAACYLSNNLNFEGTVVFIFQPSEENGLGAKAMLKDDLFTKFPIDEIYGMHNLPGAPRNSFSTREGTICSSESLFEINIQARGGHSAMPQKGVDAILVGSEIVQALQHIVARKLDPSSGCVVSVTEFTTDGRRNVLPGNALLKGDVRARTPEDRTQIKSLMQRILDGIAHSHEVEIHFSFQTEFIETINSPEQTAASITVAKGLSDQVDGNRSPMSFSEDFALFSQAKPGCFILIGNGTEGLNGKPLHASDYDFNDEILTTGASYWASLVSERLPKQDIIKC